MPNLDSLTWPLSNVAEALSVLAERSGLRPRRITSVSLPELLQRELEQSEGETISRWIEASAQRLGIEAEPLESPYAEVESLIKGAGPALLMIPELAAPRFLALLKSKRAKVTVLTPDFRTAKLQAETVRTLVCGKIEAPLVEEVDGLLQSAGVPLRRWTKVRRVTLQSRLANARVGGCWIVRSQQSAGLWRQIRTHRLLDHFLTLLVGYTIPYLLYLCSWWIIGQAALGGRFERGLLAGWALLFIAVIPLGMIATWSQGMLSIGIGTLLRQRLLYGALSLTPEEIRHQGAGQLLGRVLESDALESLALSGGYQALFAVIKLTMAVVVLFLGAGGALHAGSLVVWVVVSCLLGRRYLDRRYDWTDTRLAMTHDLVERMVGHRTRLAQEAPEHWHNTEEELLHAYLKRSVTLDQQDSVLKALVPRGWLIVGLAGIAPAFLSGHSSAAELALGLGGMLFSYRPLQQLAFGLSSLAGAVVAWKQIAPLYKAAGRTDEPGASGLTYSQVLPAHPAQQKEPLIEANSLSFRHEDRLRPAVQNCSVKISRGDRLMIEGPSGGGKSTLASLLAGMRVPQSGLLLLDGLDIRSWGERWWRRRVVLAPQFHENFVLTETFAFNLLMGRRWPPRPEDFREAEVICRELGLGELLTRMPAGLLQVVGESGWQLSHGERSRLFVARALLQEAHLIILDESFAALEHGTLQTALQCVLQRAPALVVIGHF